MHASHQYQPTYTSQYQPMVTPQYQPRFTFTPQYQPMFRQQYLPMYSPIYHSNHQMNSGHNVASTKNVSAADDMDKDMLDSILQEWKEGCERNYNLHGPYVPVYRNK